MRPRRLVAISLAFWLALFVTMVPASAQAPTPFRASLSGTVKLSGPTTLAWAGGGTSVPLGPVTSKGTATITGLSLTCLVGLANTHVETLTTVDGSTLTVTMTDVGCLSGIGTFQGSGRWTVTGATGRLTGTTGSGTASGGSNLLTGTFAFTLTGSLVLG